MLQIWYHRRLYSLLLDLPDHPAVLYCNVDVTAYAEERVRALEKAQRLANQSNTEQVAENFGEIGEAVGRVEEEEMVESQGGKPDDLSVTQAQTESDPLLVRSSTPTSGTTETAPEMNLTHLESGLRIATFSWTALPELLPAADSTNDTSAVSFLQPATDDSSSFCDAPNLPQGETKVRLLDDDTEAEETGDGSSQLSCPELYGFLPVVNDPSPREDDTLTSTSRYTLTQTGPSTSKPQDAGLRELSGRSRVTLKQCFDEDAATMTPLLGHRTVAFTEPQVYHLLRVLTDETLKMSYTAMEQMVIGTD